jgi:GTPase SAR1 family protein
VAVVGESQVGKTSMSNQLTSDGTNFPKNYLLTHMMELQVKAINIPDTNNIVELYLNDCSGKEMYSDLLGECWAGTAMIVAMYDVCREDTFGTVARVSTCNIINR